MSILIVCLKRLIFRLSIAPIAPQVPIEGILAGEQRFDAEAFIAYAFGNDDLCRWIWCAYEYFVFFAQLVEINKKRGRSRS